MNEILDKISELLTSFNNTFSTSANVIEKDGEYIANGININKLKNNGSEFIEKMFDIFGPIIESSEKYELIFDEEKGLVLAEAKEVVKIEYVYDTEKK